MATLALIAAFGRNYDVARAHFGGRIYDSTESLCLSTMFLSSFFIATVAVIFLHRELKYFYGTPHFKLRDIVSVTCAVYIFVLPFIL